MRKLVINIALTLVTVWLLAVFFSWQHAYAKAYTDEMADTGICSCKDAAWTIPYAAGYDYLLIPTPGHTVANQTTVGQEVTDCIEQRASSAAIESAFDVIMFGIVAMIIVSWISLLIVAASQAESRPEQD